MNFHVIFFKKDDGNSARAPSLGKRAKEKLHWITSEKTKRMKRSNFVLKGELRIKTRA